MKMTEEILVLAKYFKDYGVGPYSFSWFEENLKIKPDICMYALRILKEDGIIDFTIIPWVRKDWEKVELNEFLEKNTKEKHFETKGAIISLKNKKRLSEIIKSPSLLNPVLEKVGIYPEKPHFDEKKGKIFFLDKNCDIPSGNQLILCEVVFSRPFGEWVKEIDLALAIDLTDTTKGNRFIYDAMLAVNKKMKECFGIEKFMEWKSSKLRVKKELFE